MRELTGCGLPGGRRLLVRVAGADTGPLALLGARIGDPAQVRVLAGQGHL